jgi:hypothetical protein
MRFAAVRAYRRKGDTRDMNREGAETYLRVLAEAELRTAMTPVLRPGGPGSRGGGSARLRVVAQALAAVDALDPETAGDIMADLDLAADVRQGYGLSERGPVRLRPGRLRFTGSGLAPVTGGSGRPGGPEGSKGARGSDRFVAIGQAIPFVDEGAGSEVYLMSYANTGADARFTVAWWVRGAYGPSIPGTARPGMLAERFAVTDDRGGRYSLALTAGGGGEWTSEISVCPEPPDDVRWLDIATAGHPAVRVSLGPAEPVVTVDSATMVSPGEQLLILIAELLLSLAPQVQRGMTAATPLTALTARLGDVVGALEAADVLSPLSRVPGWLATLCAGLGISGHGITAPPAADLPEPWLSLLAHYGRRKPEAAPVRGGCAGVAVALPELDGIELVLLGLYNSDGNTWILALVRDPKLERRQAPFGIGIYLPLSVWVRDSGGRWHAARPHGWNRSGDEFTLRLQIVPPLPRSAEWIEVLAAGRSAQARVTLPLRWGCPP